MADNEKFIPAKESGWFITLFDLYVRTLFWRRFKHVWIRTGYLPESGDRTIYYLNHTSWWDGLIPLLLNQKLFKQKARAMMEDKQMNKHRFFRKIGAFSVNLDRKRDTVKSLRYAIQSMQRENACLFIYPEGQILNFSTEKPNFKEGLAWILSKLDNVRVVPVGVYIDHAKSDKPELYLETGHALSIPDDVTLEELNRMLEDSLQQVLIRLSRDAMDHPDAFKKL